MSIGRVVDAALDRSIALGYTSVGVRVRRRFWPADPEPGSMRGKRVLVTGATAGIGSAIVDSLATLGATVHVLGRNPEKTAKTADRLRTANPASEIIEEICDLADLDAVREWGQDFEERGLELHGLVHNAGLMTSERETSPQGHEMSLAAHVLGPHLMTDLLLPSLERAEAAVVVWMSSGGMYGAGLATGDLEYERGEYDGVKAYARTKRMQVELASLWSDRLAPGRAGGGGVQVESMHPGWVATDGVTESLPTFNKIVGPWLRDAPEGADTAVWLVATRPDSEGSEHFWHDRALRPTTLGWQREQDQQKLRSLINQVCAATGTSWPPAAVPGGAG